MRPETVKYVMEILKIEKYSIKKKGKKNSL